MSDEPADPAADELVLDYRLDAPPEKVWRALSIPAFRERWLPDSALADAEPIASTRGREIRYRMQDDAPPYLESTVTFQMRPDADGGTRLRIIHGPAAKPALMAANDDRRCLMRAA